MLALPFLESVAPTRAYASTAAAPTRVAFFFVPNGVEMAHWTPGAPGAMAEMPAILQPLAPFRDHVSVLSGLSQINATALGDGPGDHARSAAAFLTGVHPVKTAGAGIRSGISVDQVAAQRLGRATRFPSLELGCEVSALAGDCDSGYSCAYSSNISWRSENAPSGKETNPRLVFERLFGGGDSSEQLESRLTRDRNRLSILDMVLGQANDLRGRLGGEDRRKLDEYLQSIREIEQRLQASEKSTGLDKVPADFRPKGVPDSFREHIEVMGDLLAIAFQTDSTRIATMMIANEGSNRSYPEAGVGDGHHDVSHHGGLADKLAKKRAIDTFHMAGFAHFLGKLAQMKEGDGTILDHSMIVYGGGISDGNAHNHNNLPIVLAGGGFPGGRHIVFPDETPLNNLYLTMLDRLGIPVETLGNSTGELKTVF